MGRVQKNNVLSIKWSKKENDFMINYPRSCDGHLIADAILSDRLRYCIPDKEKPFPYNYEIENLKKELETRGYDLTTLKFRIELKQE